MVVIKIKMEYCLFFDGKLIIIYVYYWKFVYNICKLVKYVKKILVIYVYIILISIYYWDLKGYGFLFLK